MPLDLQVGSRVYGARMSMTEAPLGRYRIAEVARLTGFAPSALRFYEDAGVLPLPERTAAGYRVYGDRDIERLRLVGRAKDLGCTLEEITGLVQAWDADECGPVKHRLRSLVNAKVVEVERHITDQVGFAHHLKETAAMLAARAVDGPCDDSCGCTARTGSDAASGTIPSGADQSGIGAAGCDCSAPSDGGAATGGLVASVGGEGNDGPPIACSLGGGDMQARIGEWEALLGLVTKRERVPGGLRLTFESSASLSEIARLAAAEQACCPFFGFAVTIDARGIALEVAAPADGQAMLESVFGVQA
jgi:MerR family transcriptional regulator, copper efflux regulator